MAQTTPTIQDILSSYQEGVGAGGTNTALLLQALRNRQARAQEEDKQTAKSFHSGGKAFISGLKHARDFQIAQRVNPDLTLREFLNNPRNAAKLMKKGATMIESGKRLPVSTLEPFTYGSERHTINPIEQAKNTKALEELREYVYQKALSKYNRNALQSNVDIANDVRRVDTVGKKPVGNLMELRRAPVPDFTPEYVDVPNAAVDLPNWYPKTIPIGAEEAASALGVDVVGKKPVGNLMELRRAPATFPTPAKVDIPNLPPAGAEEAASALGSAGKALGNVGGALNVAGGLRGMFTDRLTAENLLQTGSGVAALAGLGPLGLALGLGSLLFKDRRRT